MSMELISHSKKIHTKQTNTHQVLISAMEANKATSQWRMGTLFYRIVREGIDLW